MLNPPMQIIWWAHMHRFMSVFQLPLLKPKHFCQGEYFKIAFRISSLSTSGVLIAKDKLHFTSCGTTKAMLCAHWVKYLLFHKLSIQNLLILNYRLHHCHIKTFFSYFDCNYQITILHVVFLPILNTIQV